jgi:glyoxylase-like metal-dependent hydrolase (beta-lactamase superfamily II)
MYGRVLLALGCLFLFGLLAWQARVPPRSARPEPNTAGWELIEKSNRLRVFRSNTIPAAYLLDVKGHGLLIDAPEDLTEPPVPIEVVLLSHHHRDTVAGVEALQARNIPILAPVESEPWLSPEGVEKFWKESIPLRSSRTAYFVLGAGIPGIQYTLKPGGRYDWHGMIVDLVATPGHSRDHLSFLADGLVFCSDAVMGSGHLPTPYTTDWDHWTDAGLKPAAESLRRLAQLQPIALYPARGPGVRFNTSEFLETLAKKIDEVGFLKSFERYTNRLGSPPKYDFLVPPEQVGSGGDKPWSRVSENIWITGNTYVITSKETKACLVLDPWGERSVKQIEKLREQEKLGPVERVIFSHAHYDHFDGVYTLPRAPDAKIWALETVAEPLREPFRLRAPFLDARPIKFDQTFSADRTATWREYTFTFRFLPGQTWYTSGLEATIDGKKCYFTADNFFHFTQYSGSGGWMGLNRTTPRNYAFSAKKVLDAKPDWILAEHGGPFVFHEEDFVRRVRWGQAAATAADAVCVSGRHRHDWNPHRFWVEPVRVEAKAGQQVSMNFYALNEGKETEPFTLLVRGPGITEQRFTAEVSAGKIQHTNISFRVPETFTPGRYIYDVIPRITSGEGSDPFFCVDVVP